MEAVKQRSKNISELQHTVISDPLYNVFGILELSN